MGKLSGKVAIVTASTDGIGLAIARRLAEDGAAVMVSSRKQQNVDSAVKELRDKSLTVSGIVCHVGNKADRERMIQMTLKEFGGIDILVSNAAVNPVFGPILDTTESAWDKIMDINVKSSFFLCKEVVPHMEARGGGSVVFVSSIGGYNVSEFMGPYGISKTALLGLTKALVPQLAQKKIRVNCIAPGLVKTRFSEQLWKNSDAASSAYTMSIPLKRFAEPEECAGIVSFLVSDDASYITGETVVIGGGVSARIGLAIARRLAEDGAAVMVSSRKQQNVDSAVKELRDKSLTVSGIVCHVGNKADRERMIQMTLKEFGGIDILVSNAAVNPVFGPILDTTGSAWDKIMDINVKSSFFLCKEVVPHMEARGGGSVVFVSSVGGYNVSEFMGPYGISKTALLGLTKALVPQLAQKKIRVNCIAPGLVKTRFSEQLWKNSDAASSAYAMSIPLKRFAEPEECAGIVSFLVSDDASYITGETVVIGGGVSARL